MTWKDVWENKDVKIYDDLETLLDNDGFNSCPGGDVVTDKWLKYHRWLVDHIGIKKSESIFEVGCGSGAFLYPFYAKGHRVGGIDYSDNHVAVCRSLFSGEFVTAEAQKLDYLTEYDNVVSYSVFQYFPDLAYAEEVLNRMMTKAGKRVIIFDIPDIELREEAEAQRRKNDPDYDVKYKDLKHLYYDKEWFYDVCMDYDTNHDFELFYHVLDGYTNSQYRYNIIIGKPCK
jgi:SAM-dependent methyltransferase